MKKKAFSRNIIKTLRYFVSIVGISTPTFATDLYVRLNSQRTSPEVELRALSSNDKYQCIEGINRLSKKLKYENKNVDELETSFVVNEGSISFPTSDGSIAIIQSDAPFRAKKFIKPEGQGIYEFKFYSDSYVFIKSPKDHCASTNPVKSCMSSNLETHKTIINGSKVSEDEISKAIYSGILDLEKVLTETKKRNPNFSHLSTELKLCIDALTGSDKEKSEKLTNVAKMLDPSNFYAGGVGGSVGGGTGKPGRDGRSLSSEGANTLGQ